MVRLLCVGPNIGVLYVMRRMKYVFNFHIHPLRFGCLYYAHCIDGETVWGKSIDSITGAFDDFSLYNECGMNWMFMPPCKFIYWKPSFQGTDFRRWGLWEVIRSWEWSPYECKSCPIKEAPENSPALLPHGITVRAQWSMDQEVGFYQTESAGALSLNFQLPKL